MTFVSNGPSPAAKRIIAAGNAYQRSRQPAPQADEDAFRRRVEAVAKALYGPIDELKDNPGRLDNSPVSVRDRVEAIIQDACRIFDVRRLELMSARREKRVAVARHYAGQRIKDETTLSLPRIGRILGGRHHTTVIHSCRPKQRQLVIDWLAGRTV